MKFEECLAFVQSAEAGFVVGGYDGDDVRPAGDPCGAVRPPVVSFEGVFDLDRDEGPRINHKLSACGSWDVLCSSAVCGEGVGCTHVK